ncbi:MAG: ADP-ribosylglycohydrolase family protein [Planctomycetota bacterium]
MAPPDSSHPKFNEHADDIDYQIEADFSGLIAPGLPNTAIKLGEKFGRLMNYGDGLYAGQFVGGMYTEAFFEKDPEKIIRAGLKCIPQQSQYAECVRDVLEWHRQYPDDWKKTWQLLQDKYLNNPKYRQGSCTGGVHIFNIDAKLNGAYIVMGLLYGERDIMETMLASIRCGQDADCNPSNAAGVLFTTIGYSNLPEEYKSGLIETHKFFYSNYTFSQLAKLCERLAREAVLRSGGRIEKNIFGEEVFVIPVQEPKPSEFVQVWEPGPIANSRFTKKEMSQITGATKDLSEYIPRMAPGWSIANCGNGKKGITAIWFRKEKEGKKNVILTHPLNRTTPCVLLKTVILPKDKKSTLKLTVSNHEQYKNQQPRGQWLLIVKANGTELLNQLINDDVTKKDWMEINIDLSEYAGRETKLEVVNKANEIWGENTASWAGIEIISK